MLWTNLSALLVTSVVFIVFPRIMIVAWLCSAAFGFFQACLFATTFLFVEECVTICSAKAGWLILSGNVGASVIPLLLSNVMTFFGDYYFGLSIFCSELRTNDIVLCHESMR